LEKRTERLNLAFEPGIADLQIVSFRFDFLQFGFEGAHLVDTLLAIATGGQGVRGPLFDFG
jgi:hypothetical protein